MKEKNSLPRILIVLCMIFALASTSVYADVLVHSEKLHEKNSVRMYMEFIYHKDKKDSKGELVKRIYTDGVGSLKIKPEGMKKGSEAFCIDATEQFQQGNFKTCELDKFINKSGQSRIAGALYYIENLVPGLKDPVKIHQYKQLYYLTN